MNLSLSPPALRLAHARRALLQASALIFDVDGTLAETEEVHRQAFNDAFVTAGLDWHWGRTIYKELLQVAGGKERIALLTGGGGDRHRFPPIGLLICTGSRPIVTWN